MTFQERLQLLMQDRGNVKENIPREQMIRDCVNNGEVMVSACGALANWTSPESTGRSPKDTLIVKRPASEETIDWTSPNNIGIDEAVFDEIMEDALKILAETPHLYRTDRLIGADPLSVLPVHTIANAALTALFTDNMFRPWDDDAVTRSCFNDRPFTLVVLPRHKLDSDKYTGKLRIDPVTQKTSTMFIGMDFDRRLGVVIGSSYCGSVKKLMFTVMNYLLPAEGILPLHCSANEGKDGDSALLLGLSGTGKTTLSADPSRALLGDDEHGWSDHGIGNFENGCYAKMIDLDPEKEPEIYNACFHHDDYEKHGVIVENAMIFPDGSFDLSDTRLTPNSRASYPLKYLSNIKPSSVSGHPKTILFLTADANGVLPPISKLNREQTMLWFLMGYTSKLAGTETGIIEPVSTFSRFFGAPFMPCRPSVYTHLLGEKMEKHGTRVYLVNTGWTGGPYGIGMRIDLRLTRLMVNAALSGELDDIPSERDRFFKVFVPKACPGIDSIILKPHNVWRDWESYKERAMKLATEFANHFEKAYSDTRIAIEVANECPGR